VNAGTGALSLPKIGAGGMVNAAGGASPSGLAPGSIISIYGNNMANGTYPGTLTNGSLPTNLGGTSVVIAGQSAPLFYVSPGQINAQVPLTDASGAPLQGTPQAYVMNTTNPLASLSDSETTTIATSGPGIFALNQGGTGQGAVQIANTSTFAAPTGSISGSTSRPAVRGTDFISIFCTGLGAVSNPPPTGTPATGSGSTTILPVTVQFGSVSVQAPFAGLAPGFVGLYQVNVQVPANAPAGSAVPLTVTVNGAVSNTVTIATQ
jgi:uncharacterized protein (TIGR03437 family)